MKKIIMMVLAFVIITSAVIGGTWAAEVSEQEAVLRIASDNGINLVNHIEQPVTAYDGACGTDVKMEPVPKIRENPLYPAVYSTATPQVNEDTGCFDNVSNVIDYYVSAELQAQDLSANILDTYYVRTVFAFENKKNAENPDGIVDKMYFNRNMSSNEVVWQGFGDNSDDKINVNIDGTDYRLFVCTYQQPISAGQKTPYSMRQFCFSKEATSEDFDFGEYEIKVQSQCVPEKELFNTISAINHPWFGSQKEDNEFET